MKKIVYATALIICAIVSHFCEPPSKGNKSGELPVGDNSRNSLDWDGIYRGTLPCADCQGIQTTIYLNKDLTYKVKTKYLGKDDPGRERSGAFTWNDAGNTITLDATGTDRPTSYFVGENTLTQLDAEGKKVTGELAANYMLSKESYAILEKYWKLTELYGKPVAMDSTFLKEPHIIFKEADNRYNGHGGCNGISGSYELISPNRIKLSQGISTQIACDQLAIEKQFLQALNTADSYTISGDMLVLNKAKMAPLARFKTVYMK